MATTAFLNAQVVADRVQLLYRDEAGTLRQKSVPAEWVSYHPIEKDPEVAAAFERAVRMDRRVLGSKREGDYLRVRWRGKWDRRDACKQLRENGFTVLEGDVNPIRRLVSDLGLGIAKPRRLYFDIETDSRVNFARSRQGLARVLSFCARDEEGNRYVAILEEWTDEAEARLLEQFWQLAAGYDQLVAWSGRHGSDTYDFVVLEQRSKLLGAMPKDIARWLWLDHHDVFERMNKNASESGAEKRSLKLHDVSMELLKHGKDSFDSSKTYEAWEWAHAHGLTKKIGRGMTAASIPGLAWWGHECLPGLNAEEFAASMCPLLRYNLKDVDLMVEIEQKTGYLATFQVICELCRTFANTYSLYPTVQMDGFMLRLGVERGVHFPTKWYDQEEPQYQNEEQFEGAYVLHPTVAGIVEQVHVGDFASMYPSVIITWNMSPETLLGDFPEHAQPPGSARAPVTGACFSTAKQGTLPYAELHFLEKRDYWKKLKASFPPGSEEAADAERHSSAFKVIANSFFGALGNKFCRFFIRLIAESISTTGAFLSRATEWQACLQGIEPICGDTDALMVRNCTRERFLEFIDWCNDVHYPELIAATGAKMVPKGQYGRVTFENEKGYERIVFFKKNDGKPASKRYVGVYSYYKGAAATAASKPEVKGIEYRRGDSNLMLAQMQWEFVEVFWKGDWRAVEPYVAIVDRWKRRVLEDALTVDQVKVSKSLTKPIDGYAVKQKLDGTDSALPEHVRVAKVMLARGADIGEGTRIEFYMHDHPSRDVRPAEDYQGECDRHYLWENKLYPACQRLFEGVHPGHDWKQYGKSRPKAPRKRRDLAPEIAHTISPKRGIRRSRPSPPIDKDSN